MTEYVINVPDWMVITIFIMCLVDVGLMIANKLMAIRLKRLSQRVIEKATDDVVSYMIREVTNADNKPNDDTIKR